MILILNYGTMLEMGTPEKKSLIRYEVDQMNSAEQNQSHEREPFVSPRIRPTWSPLYND
jgi:hypothetical protein